MEKYKLNYQAGHKQYEAGIAEGKEELKMLWLGIPREHYPLQNLHVYRWYEPDQKWYSAFTHNNSLHVFLNN